MARAFLYADSKVHDNLSDQLSPALLSGGKSEAPWLVRGPLARQQPRGHWNRGLSDSGPTFF